ncbi:hypothetical protein PV327_006128 [Microctonus hyperodae]|uniref:protein-tyrosine-phosphatase n=1 Tax=Microctonus hyperodae TaxID=165561 RepID=A0AA39L0J7_MICHY|nr:hypothetical protein PV327_006128 [Microctonus hyperodae]
MIKKKANKHVRKYTDILLLVLSISLMIQLEIVEALSPQKHINKTHEFSIIESSVNSTDLREADKVIDAVLFKTLNNNYSSTNFNDDNVERYTSSQSATVSSLSFPSVESTLTTIINAIPSIQIEKSTSPSQDIKDMKNRLSKMDVTTSSNSQIASHTKLHDQDGNDNELSVKYNNDEKLLNNTNLTMISPTNDTIVDHYDVIKHMNNTNTTPMHSNIVEKLEYTAGNEKIFEDQLTFATNSNMIETVTMDNNQTTNIIDNKKLVVNISPLTSISNSTERMVRHHTNHDIEAMDRAITSTEINQFGNVKDKEINMMHGIKPYPYTNVDHVIKIKNLKHEENNIDKSYADKKLIITGSSNIIDNNSIQQMKQTIYYKRPKNSSTIISKNSLKIPAHFENLQSQKNFNFSLTLKSNIKNNINSDNVLMEKRSNLDLTDNNLHEVVEKNLTNFQSITPTNMTTIEIFDNGVTMKNVLNNSFLNNKSDIQSNIQNSKFIISSINITENSTLLPNHINTYTSSSTLPSFSSSQNPSDTSPYMSFSPASLEHDVSLPSIAIATNKFEVLTSTPLINSSSIFTSKMIQPDYSSIQIIDTSSTTISNVQYDFIRLGNKTNIINKNNITDNHYFVSNTTETSIKNSSSNVTEFSFDNKKNNATNNVIVKNLHLNDSNTITNLSINNESISTIDVTHLYTTTYSTIMNFDFDDDAAVIYETSTLLPHTETFVSHISSTSLITTIGESESTIIHSSQETLTTAATTDVSTAVETTSTLTTAISSSIFEFNIEADTSTISNDFTTTSNTENITIISKTPIMINTTHSISSEDITVLVKIVVETNWSDVCLQLSALRQALADILSMGMSKIFLAHQVIFQTNPCTDDIQINGGVTPIESTILTTLLLYIVDDGGNFDLTSTKILPNLYKKSTLKLTNISIRSFQLVEDTDSGNAIAVIVVSCVALICLALLASLLFVMRKRQTRFNYGERCRPVSLDTYSLDNVSAHNSVRRKGAIRMSKRSYGNPTFEDSSAIPSHPLNFASLSVFCNEQNTIFEEFTSIPQVSARIDELPTGAEIKNRYANVVPLPETRVPLMRMNNDPLTEYINANFVRGPKNAIKYYIGCQAPIDTTVIDFWRMIWEQQSKVIIMLTDLIENGIEKCAEYIPPSEVIDCNRLYGDFQVTLKKRETKEKYAISTLHLKNLENNTYREISHIWYLWPTSGVLTDSSGLIAVLLEARAVQRGGSGPIVVHCSPGTGRTGTIIALDLGIRQYEITRTVDVPRIVYTIRRDRAGAVQTKEQYFFIYKALNFYAAKLAGGGLEST